MSGQAVIQGVTSGMQGTTPRHSVSIALAVYLFSFVGQALAQQSVDETLLEAGSAQSVVPLPESHLDDSSVPDSPGQEAAGSSDETIVMEEQPSPATSPDDISPEPVTGTVQPSGVEGKSSSPCGDLDSGEDPWLDRAQTTLYRTTCSAATWFDGFFGKAPYDSEYADTFGRLGMSALWDQRDGLDQKVRFRARWPLPALEDRTDIMLGRGDEQEMIEDRQGAQYDTLPGAFSSPEDDSVLLGLGYGHGGVERGVRLSVGARISTPVDPYVKATYRRAWTLSNNDFLKARPVIYWRGEDGFGSSINLDLDHLISDNFMLRFGNWANAAQTEEVEGLQWSSSLILFQGLSNRKALTYKALVVGETKAEVPIKNYGFEVVYRQRILRKWLFLEVGSSVTWPRDFLVEERNVNWGASIGVEMYFGPFPEDQMR
jgi:hypothetical protein